MSGLERELKGEGVLAVLPGSNDKVLSFVVASSGGHPVLRQGFVPAGFRFAASSPEFGPGDTVALVNATGDLLLAGVLSVARVGANEWQASLAACSNTLPWTEGTRAYKASVVTLDAQSGQITLTRDGRNLGVVGSARDYRIAYVYRGPDGAETLEAAYAGAQKDGKALVAVGLSAAAGSNRALTARLPVGARVGAGSVIACGASPNAQAGTGVVTVVVNPEPPGGGDVTLGATNYTKTFRSTRTFTDVPVGPIQVQSRDVWTDSLTAWAPSPYSWSGTLYAFSPVTVRVSYSIVPGTIVFSAGGFPSDGVATVSAGGYSASVGGGQSRSVSALPGVYGTSASPEVAVSRSGSGVSWTEVYTLQSVSPAQVTVRSYGTAGVSASYSGPLPGTLCYDSSCQTVAPGAYSAPANSILRTWTVTRSNPCSSGYVGRIIVTEYWREVKYWTPGVVGVSSRGTGQFTSATRQEMYDSVAEPNCEDPPRTDALDATDNSSSDTSEQDWSNVNVDIQVVPSGSGTSGAWRGLRDNPGQVRFRLSLANPSAGMY